MENWNDDRLDELSRRMDAGFKEMRDGFVRVDREMKEGFACVDQRFERINDRLDKLIFAIMVGGGGFAATTIAALIGIAVL